MKLLSKSRLVRYSLAFFLTYDIQKKNLVQGSLCITAAGLPVAADLIETVSIVSANACKAKCKAKGKECTGYWVSTALDSCQMFNTDTVSLVSDPANAAGTCYTD